MQREDVFQYPSVAIREAVMNALLHADYAMKREGNHSKNGYKTVESILSNS